MGLLRIRGGKYPGAILTIVRASHAYTPPFFNQQQRSCILGSPLGAQRTISDLHWLAERSVSESDWEVHGVM